MGAIWFEKGRLADELHELIGYKAGIATSIPEICDLLLGTSYPDTLLESEKGTIRLRAEVFEDLYYEILCKIGHTPDKHQGQFELFDYIRVLHRDNGDDFAGKVVDIFKDGIERLSKEAVKSGKKSIDPTPMILEADRSLGPIGALKILDLIKIQDRVMRLSPFFPQQRMIEWKNIISLDGIFERSSGSPEHGKFIDQRLIDFLSSNSHLLREMHWRKFEELVAEYFYREGFKVELGPGQNDEGIDIRIWIPSSSMDGKIQLHLVQCKRQLSKVEKIIVKGLYADVLYEKADLGVLVTTSELSPGAKNTINLRGYPIQEVNGEKVKEWLYALRTPGSGIVRI